jgi:hypothetical protein
MEKISSDTDIHVSNDIGEVFESGWRKKIEDARKDEYTRAKYMFVLSHNEDDSINKQFPMEKIHRRHGFNGFILYTGFYNTAARRKKHEILLGQGIYILLSGKSVLQYYINIW